MELESSYPANAGALQKRTDNTPNTQGNTVRRFPSMRTVYDKFRALGYPTDHDRGSRSHNAGSPGSGGTCAPPTCHQPLRTSIVESSVPRAVICVPVENESHAAEIKSADIGAGSTSFQNLNKECRRGYHNPSLQEGQVFHGTLAGRNALESPRHPEKEIFNDTTFDVPSSATTHIEKPLQSSILRSGPSEHLKICPPQQRKRRNTSTTSNTPEQEIIIENLRKAGLLPRPHHSGGRTKPPGRSQAKSTRTTDSKSPSYAHPVRKIRSLLEMRPNRCKNRTTQESPFADNDSGYHSGRVTPSTLHSRDSLTSHPVSLLEFEGLYRVTCQAVHEPKDPDRHQEIQTCQFCGYSNIHNLAWSATHIMLHDFEAELESKSLDELQALDAAGNSALHYAAIGGASYAHIKALIDAGVPICQNNTANQNFLHCLRPCDADKKSYSVDCYKLGLIKLLELVELEIPLGQQDNYGQTELHVLALHIIQPEVRARTFEIFKTHRLPWTTLDRFGKSAKDISSPVYQYEQTMIASDTFSTIGTSLLDIEPLSTRDFEINLRKKLNANDLLVEAHDNPHCVDSTTKDTILHALSRLNVQSGGSMQSHDIIRYLQQFVSKGVNLNRYNYDGHHPLSAFVCNQDFRGGETGATMAKYIDILLWKDGKHREYNNINVDMMNRKGATALYEAAVHAQSDSVRSLIEAGANVNARLNGDPRGVSVLQATIAARNKAVIECKDILHHDYKNVISHLEHAGAVAQPTSLEERGRTT